MIILDQPEYYFYQKARLNYVKDSWNAGPESCRSFEKQ